MRFWTCWEALDLDYMYEKRVFDLGRWLARYCIPKIEYVIVSYIIILKQGSIGGLKNNIASIFAPRPGARSYSCYIIFSSPNIHTRLKAHASFISYHYGMQVGRRYALLFSDNFYLLWYDMYCFIWLYSRITLKILEFIRKWNLSFLGDLARQSFKECIFFKSSFSAFLIYEILRYIFWCSGLYFSLFLPIRKLMLEGRFKGKFMGEFSVLRNWFFWGLGPFPGMRK